MNTITERVKIGTIGELLVALRFLINGVQAASPLKDSGNDLIAVKVSQFRAIQVKTTTGTSFGLYDLPERYHIAALVQLVTANGELDLQQSKIFLLTKEQIDQRPNKYYQAADLGEFLMSQNYVDALFDYEPGEVELEFVED